jgi:hypothetical protein
LLVAILVPVVVVLGVAAALLVLYVTRRQSAAYDRRANQELAERQLGALRTDYHQM